MERVFVGLGSNLGDRLAHLEAGLDGLARLPRTRVLARSGLYVTEPVGGPRQREFFNAVCELRTRLGPVRLLEGLHAIEAMRGRFRAVQGGPRTLDLDLLLFGDRRIDSPRLQLPHPRLHERSFVLVPLADLAPHERHPALGTRYDVLADETATRDPVRRHPLSGGARWPSSR